MRRGPDQVIECPKCKGPARVFTLLSGNTFNATLWTDGKMVAPMLPRPPEITKCRYCGHFFWLSDAREIGKFYPWKVEDESIPSEWKNAEYVKELSESEYLEAIKMGAADRRAREVELRISAWWAGNDFRRSKSKRSTGRITNPLKRTRKATMNLERLLELLEMKNPNERLMGAEILRELGRFDEAIQLLEFNFPKQYSRVATLIRELAEKKDSIVREIVV